MSDTLTLEEKQIIVNQHIRNLDFSIYGLEMDLVESNAVSPTDSEYVSTVQDRLDALNLRKAALIAEKDALVALAASSS
jgi:hypothetical protein